MKKHFILCALFLVASLLSARTVRVGYFGQLNYLPSHSLGIDSGYYDEYVKKIAEKTGWDCKKIDLDTADPIENLENGSIDLLYDMTYTAQRAEKFLFSKYPCAVEFEILVAQRADARYHNGDTQELQHARIGLIEDDPLQDKTLDAFIHANHLDVTKVYYRSSDLMAEGLVRGVIDLRMASAMAPRASEKIVYNFGVHPVYFMCHDKAIKTELDAAMDSLLNENPLYQIDLVMRGSGMPILDFKNITAAEKDFISRFGPVTVLMGSNSYPFSYYNKATGTYEGLECKFWDTLSLITNLKFCYHEDKNVTHGMPAVFFSVQSKNGLKDGFRFTIPFRTIEAKVICAPGVAIQDLATSGSRFSAAHRFRFCFTEDVKALEPFFEETFLPFTVVSCDSPQECLELVASGRADAAVIQSYYLQTEYSINDYRQLSGRIPATYEIPVSIAAAGTGADVLIPILNKGLNQIPYNFFETIESSQGVIAEYKPAKAMVLRQIILISLGVLLVILLYTLGSAMFHAQQYKKRSETDALTGLWNISKFEHTAEKMMENQPNSNFIFMELNVRGFTQINRMYGAAYADSLLVYIAARLKKDITEHKNIFAARGYADSFYILEEVSTKENAVRYLKMRLPQFKKDRAAAGFQVIINMGLVFCGRDYGGADSVRDLIGKASYARKSIRNSVVENIAVFDGKLQEQLSVEERIENCMDKALERNEFYVVFQPKVNLYTGKIEGAEALARWNSPENGSVPPDVFFPIFEKNGYAAKVDFFIYEAAFEYMQRMLDNGYPLVPVSLNISRLHLDADKFVSDFVLLYSRYSIPAKYVELEIVERAAGSNDKLLKEMTEKLHEKGFAVAMDDFGAGESSLNMLSEIPVDAIKFDQRFLKEAENSNASRIILSQMVKMVRMLGKRTLCEGVEYAKQVELLKEVGCDTAQGYFYSRPLSPEDFRTYVIEHL